MDQVFPVVGSPTASSDGNVWVAVDRQQRKRWSGDMIRAQSLLQQLPHCEDLPHEPQHQREQVRRRVSIPFFNFCFLLINFPDRSPVQRD